MPKASVPAVIPLPKPPKIVLDDKQKAGYSFTDDRWEGEEHYSLARVTSMYWQQQGWTTGLHEGKRDRWAGGKKTEEPYFKVYLVHPKDKGLYAWWTPSALEWAEPPKMDELTWFEFVKPSEDKKK